MLSATTVMKRLGRTTGLRMVEIIITTIVTFKNSIIKVGTKPASHISTIIQTSQHRQPRGLHRQQQQQYHFHHYHHHHMLLVDSWYLARLLGPDRSS
jgi:hypothetical protein